MLRPACPGVHVQPQPSSHPQSEQHALAVPRHSSSAKCAWPSQPSDPPSKCCSFLICLTDTHWCRSAGRGAAPSGAVNEEAQCKEDEGSHRVELLEGARALAEPKRRQPANTKHVISVAPLLHVALRLFAEDAFLLEILSPFFGSFFSTSRNLIPAI